MTHKERIVANEMIELADKIKTEMSYINTRERIPQLQLETIVNRVRSLYEKSIILCYLHKNIDSILKTGSVHNSLENNFEEDSMTTVNSESENAETKLDDNQKIKTDSNEDVSTKIVETDLMASNTTPISLNDKLSSGYILNNFHNHATIDLKAAIGINEKFAFQKELFNNDRDAYEKIISILNNLNTLEEAKHYWDSLIIEYSWDDQNTVASKLWQLVEKRLG